MTDLRRLPRYRLGAHARSSEQWRPSASTTHQTTSERGLAARNGPDTSRNHPPTATIPRPGLAREERLAGPYTLIATNGEDYTIQTSRGIQIFRSTVVKLYYGENQRIRPTPRHSPRP